MLLSPPLILVQNKIINQQVDIEGWFREQWQKIQPSFYSSVDLRNAGYKLAPIDTNLFPAGFNNINMDHMPLYAQAMQATMQEICPDIKNLLLIPEAHTRNLFYFESIAILKEILMLAGYEVRIGFLDSTLQTPQTILLPSGKKIFLEPIKRQANRIGVENFYPCCILLNNDLSSGIPEILQDLEQKIIPPAQLGWSTRLKSEHFRYYEKIAEEFAQAFNFDPWVISPFFDQCPEIDFMKKEGQECLMLRADALLKKIKKKYAEYAITQNPFLVIKADQGTYGMAVMTLRDPEELRHLNRKQRTRMSTLKGGMPVTKIIIQEGIYTFETVADDAVAEPVVYLLGRHVIGGFYRVHKDRGADENLNAPGMNFFPLPFAKPCNIPSNTKKEEENRFYLYGVIARLATLAAGYELAAFQQEK